MKLSPHVKELAIKILDLVVAESSPPESIVALAIVISHICQECTKKTSDAQQTIRMAQELISSFSEPSNSDHDPDHGLH